MPKYKLQFHMGSSKLIPYIPDFEERHARRFAHALAHVTELKQWLEYRGYTVQLARDFKLWKFRRKLLEIRWLPELARLIIKPNVYEAHWLRGKVHDYTQIMDAIERYEEKRLVITTPGEA